MIDQNFPDIYAFGHGILTEKKTIVCDLSRAQIVLWGHECQNISEILCENFVTVYGTQRFFKTISMAQLPKNETLYNQLQKHIHMEECHMNFCHLHKCLRG